MVLVLTACSLAGLYFPSTSRLLHPGRNIKLCCAAKAAVRALTGTCRFRRRQKAKIAELEAQVASLSLQSKALNEERTAFNTEVSALNSAIAQRDQQLSDANVLLAQVGLMHISLLYLIIA